MPKENTFRIPFIIQEDYQKYDGIEEELAFGFLRFTSQEEPSISITLYGFIGRDKKLRGPMKYWEEDCYVMIDDTNYQTYQASLNPLFHSAEKKTAKKKDKMKEESIRIASVYCKRK